MGALIAYLGRTITADRVQRLRAAVADEARRKAEATAREQAEFRAAAEQIMADPDPNTDQRLREWAKSILGEGKS